MFIWVIAPDSIYPLQQFVYENVVNIAGFQLLLHCQVLGQQRVTRLLPSCRWQSTRPSFVEHSSEIETNWAAKERRGERESESGVNRSKGEMKHLPNRLNDFLFSPKCHITLSHIRFSLTDVCTLAKWTLSRNTAPQPIRRRCVHF